MKSRVEFGCVVGILALMLLVPGCKRHTSTSGNSADEQDTPPAKQVSLTGPQGSGVATSGTLRAVGRTVELNEMHTFAQFYFDYCLTNNMPPANLEALGLARPAPNLYNAIKEGEVEVYWGVDGTKTAAGAGNTILAYPKKAAKPGAFAIPVAFYDGTARNLTEPVFKMTAKGGK